jgi:hypothetical protein
MNDRNDSHRTSLDGRNLAYASASVDQVAESPNPPRLTPEALNRLLALLRNLHAKWRPAATPTAPERDQPE